MTLQFGTDGIRGIANAELTPELMTALGRSAVRVLGADAPFLIGRDTRRSGSMIQAALVAGLCAEGADVGILGVLPTPAVAYLARARNAPALMISASHNSFEDNGVKIFASGGKKLSDALQHQIESELRLLTNSAVALAPTGADIGVDRVVIGALDDYVKYVVDSFSGRRLDGLRVVLDCGNGAAFLCAPEIFSALGAEVEVINAVPDGENINRECGSTDTTALCAAVKDSGADAGLAFDGDADRVIAIDEFGGVVDGDQMMAICALDLKEQGKLRGNAVVSTVMANLGLRRCLEAEDIELVEVPVGDRFVLEALEQRNLALGGEQSGHIIFSDLANTGDGILTGACILDVVRATHNSLSVLSGVMQKFPQVLINVSVRDLQAVMKDSEFMAELQAVEFDLALNGRALVRLSGTEPVVRVMVEAPSVAQAELITDRLVAAVLRAGGGPASTA
ncbi:MAG: phosphoglucosamine mutase [Actinobacteria bacterium]|nr:MAG: phosphoglucosamine mutase [Actinomycetota bacterium]